VCDKVTKSNGCSGSGGNEGNWRVNGERRRHSSHCERERGKKERKIIIIIIIIGMLKGSSDTIKTFNNQRFYVLYCFTFLNCVYTLYL
jgi:hypothetical protein